MPSGCMFQWGEIGPVHRLRQGCRVLSEEIVKPQDLVPHWKWNEGIIGLSFSGWISCVHPG